MQVDPKAGWKLLTEDLFEQKSQKLNRKGNENLLEHTKDTKLREKDTETTDRRNKQTHSSNGSTHGLVAQTETSEERQRRRTGNLNTN